MVDGYLPNLDESTLLPMIDDDVDDDGVDDDDRPENGFNLLYYFNKMLVVIK